MAGEHCFSSAIHGYVRDIFVTHQRKFMKGRGLERAKRLLGEGLLTSEGAAHVRQRRLMQPAFHRDRIASYASVMTEYADRVPGSWTDGSDDRRLAGDDAADARHRRQDAVRHGRRVAGDGSGRGAHRRHGTFWMTMLPFVDLHRAAADSRDPAEHAGPGRGSTASSTA